MVDIPGEKSGSIERPSYGPFAQLEGHTLECVVALGETLQRSVLLEREGEVPAAHLHRTVQIFDALDVEMLASPQFAEDADQRLLIDPVRVQSGPDAAHP